MFEGSLRAPSSDDNQMLGIEVGGLGAGPQNPETVPSRGNQLGLRAECNGTETLGTCFTFKIFSQRSELRSQTNNVCGSWCLLIVAALSGVVIKKG